MLPLVLFFALAAQTVGSTRLPNGDCSLLASYRDVVCLRYESGNVACFGEQKLQSNSMNCGIKSSAQYIGVFEYPYGVPDIDFGVRIVGICGGDAYACALSDANDVFCWGKAGFGYAQDLHVGIDVSPREAGPIDIGKKIDMVACSYHSACALDFEGHVWCWGPVTNVDHIPVHLKNISTEIIVRIWPTLYGHCVVDATNKLFCWGSNVKFYSGLETGNIEYNDAFDQTIREVGPVNFSISNPAIDRILVMVGGSFNELRDCVHERSTNEWYCDGDPSKILPLNGSFPQNVSSIFKTALFGYIAFVTDDGSMFRTGKVPGSSAFDLLNITTFNFTGDGALAVQIEGKGSSTCGLFDVGSAALELMCVSYPPTPENSFIIGRGAGELSNQYGGKYALLGSERKVVRGCTLTPSPAPTLAPTTLAPTPSPTPSPTLGAGACGGNSYYSTLAGACTPCPANHISSPTTGVECVCAGGYYPTLSSFQPDGSMCSACPIGYFCPVGFTVPVQCTRNGTAATTSGLESCASCGARTSVAPFKECFNCAAGEEGIDGVCRACEPGTYKLSNATPSCLACPANAECKEGGAAEPAARPGYYGQFDATTGVYLAYQCASVAACPGGALATCGAHRAGELCSACEAGYFMFAERCVECPEQFWLFMLLALVLVVVGIVLYALFEPHLRELGGLPMLIISFGQTLAVFSLFSIPWPTPLFAFLRLFNFLALNVDAAGPECFGLPFSYADWWHMTVWTVAALTLLALAPTVRVNERVARVHVLLRKSTWIALRLLYVSVAVRTFSAMHCREQPDRRLSLVAAPELTCFSDTSHVVMFTVAVVVGFGLLVVGVPAYWALRTRRECARIRAAWRDGRPPHQPLPLNSDISFLREEFYAATPRPLVTSPFEAKQFDATTRFVVQSATAVDGMSLKERVAPFWAMVPLLRKFLLVLIATTSTSGASQLVMALLVVLAALAAHRLVSPYRYDAAMLVETFNLLTHIFLITFGGMALMVDDGELDSAAYVAIGVIVAAFVADFALLVIRFKHRNQVTLRDANVAYTENELTACRAAGVAAIAEVVEEMTSDEEGDQVELLEPLPSAPDSVVRGRRRGASEARTFDADALVVVFDLTKAPAARRRARGDAYAAAARSPRRRNNQQQAATAVDAAPPPPLPSDPGHGEAYMERVDEASRTADSLFERLRKAQEEKEVKG